MFSSHEGHQAYRNKQQQIALLLQHLTLLPQQECFPYLLSECARNPILLRTRLVDIVQAVFHVGRQRALTVVRKTGKQWDTFQGKYSLITINDMLATPARSDRFILFLLTCLREFNHIHSYIPEGYPFSILRKENQ